MSKNLKLWIPVIVVVISGIFGLAEIILQNTLDQEQSEPEKTTALPPLPTDAIEIDAEVKIESQDYETGDVFIEYTLILKNITDETLEKVILLDFQTPSDITMEKEYFEIYELSPGEKRLVVFKVVVKAWGLESKDQIYEVGFTIRIENENGYAEEDASYQIKLYAD